MLQKLYKIRNRKGFTLMEMLIVVAIIAILVAISIPLFAAQLDKAKKATDDANLRSAKAVAYVSYMDGTLNGDGETALKIGSSLYGGGEEYYVYYYNAEDGFLVENFKDIGELYGKQTGHSYIVVKFTGNTTKPVVLEWRADS